MSKDETIDPEFNSRFKIQSSKGRKEGRASPFMKSDERSLGSIQHRLSKSVFVDPIQDF